MNYDDSDISGQITDKVQLFTKNTENMQIVDIILDEANLHYRQMERVAVAYSEFYLSGKNEEPRREKHKREIFEAQNQLKKYMDCEFDQNAKYNPQMPQIYPLFMYFPCVVFDGPLYEAIIVDNDLELKEAKHLVLTSTFRSPYAIYEESVLIDIVQRSFFEEYLEIIEKDKKTLQRVVLRKSRKIIQRTKEIIELLGTYETKK